MLLVVLMVKKFRIKKNQKEFRIEKVIKGKLISCMSKVKAMIIRFIVGLIKNILHKMSRRRH